ncbi:MAG: YceD family protein [Pseudomonadota bacterium]
MNAFVIDVFEFSRVKERREGSVAVAEFSRLSEDCADNSGTLHWLLEGGTSKLGYPQLTLSVTGVVQLMCQRCLTSYAFNVAAKSLLILAKNDESADEIDALMDDDTIDVIVGTKEFNITDLIEDEALLALPLSPRHEVCPDPAVLDAFQSKKESPFSALKDMKQ